MATHKERLKTLEIHVNNIQEDMANMFAELQRLSESLNSRGDAWQGSLSQSKVNNHSPGMERESGRVNSLQKGTCWSSRGISVVTKKNYSNNQAPQHSMQYMDVLLRLFLAIL